MSEFITLLTRKNSLKKQTQSLSVEQIEKVIGDLEDIKSAKVEEENALLAEERQKQDKIQEILAQITESGLDVDDVLSEVSAMSQPKLKAEAKYKITVDGEEHTWSGRGRTPLAFKAYMEKEGIEKDQLPSV